MRGRRRMYGHRPSYLYDAGTEHSGFSPIRMLLSALSAPRAGVNLVLIVREDCHRRGV